MAAEPAMKSRRRMRPLQGPRLSGDDNTFWHGRAPAKIVVPNRFFFLPGKAAECRGDAVMRRLSAAGGRCRPSSNAGNEVEVMRDVMT